MVDTNLMANWGHEDYLRNHVVADVLACWPLDAVDTWGTDVLVGVRLAQV